MPRTAILFGEHWIAIGLKTASIAGGCAYFVIHSVAVMAQTAVPDAKAVEGLATTALGTGAVVGVLYWSINRIDRIFKEDREEREANEKRREEKWMAHDSKRDETLREMQEANHAQYRTAIESVKEVSTKQGAVLERNTEQLIRSDSTLRRCEERHSRDDLTRKATG